MSQKEAVKRPVARKDMTRAQWTWKEMKRNKTAYFFVAPFMLIFIVFTVFPVLLSIVLSFTDFNLLEWPEWVGVSNYIRLFLEDDVFMSYAIKNTLIFAIITGPTSYLMSLFIAWFINELEPKIRAVVTLVFYAPSISGQAYLVWGILFNDDFTGLRIHYIAGGKPSVNTLDQLLDDGIILLIAQRADRIGSGRSAVELVE